jgi:8-oxo-dGTP diphosphatase
MPLLDEPFSFNYFGHTIVARSLGPIDLPNVSEIISSHVIPFTSEGNIVAVNIISRGWDIPGGHIDEDEISPLEALHREAHEEALVSVTSPVLVDVLSLKSDTMDLSKTPFMTLYAARVGEMKEFIANNEVSQRKVVTPAVFIESYFGNKLYAAQMVKSAIQLLPSL